MKKICFVMPRAYYLFNPATPNQSDKVGGAQKQFYLISRYLADNKEFDVNFLVADFGQQAVERIENVNVYRTFNFQDNIIWRFIDLFRGIKKTNADIYFFRSSHFSIAIIIFIIKMLLGKKVVYMVASDAEINFKSHRKTNGLFTALLMSYVYKYADRIIVQSQQQYDLFQKNYKRIPEQIIKNIVEQQNIEDDNFSAREKILWIGRLDKIKNPDIFISLCQKFAENKFVMIAPAVFENKRWGEEMIAKIKSVPNIEHLNYVSPNEIQKYYKEARLYVITSDSEGYSNTMLEAISNHCPILSYKVNNDNILINYKIGMTADGDIDYFYKIFDMLINNKKLLTEMLFI